VCDLRDNKVYRDFTVTLYKALPIMEVSQERNKNNELSETLPSDKTRYHVRVPTSS